MSAADGPRSLWPPVLGWRPGRRSALRALGGSGAGSWGAVPAGVLARFAVLAPLSRAFRVALEDSNLRPQPCECGPCLRSGRRKAAHNALSWDDGGTGRSPTVAQGEGCGAFCGAFPVGFRTARRLRGLLRPSRLDLRHRPARPGSSGPAPNHDGPPRAAKASSIRRYMRPSASPSTSLNPNFA